MRRTGSTLILISVAWLLLAPPVRSQGEDAKPGPPPPPPLRAIPGLTADDPHPNGCVDCHVPMKDLGMDTRISTLMGQWIEGVEPGLLANAKAAAVEPAKIKGRHPAARGALRNIPAACLSCHGRDAKAAPPFARLMHRIHLVGGEQNHFMTYFQGDCTHCHKLDPATGAWSLPSASEPDPGP